MVLCKKYPGHQIPQRVVAEYSMNDKFQPLLRANHVVHHRQDIHGMAYAHAIKVFVTKLVAIYPIKTHTAQDVASVHICLL